jgi:GNAT acetyltransferase-like protein
MALTWSLVEGRAETDRVWDEIARSCGYATFFHTRAWAELFASTLGTWEPDPVAIEFSDGNLAVLPMLRRLDSEHRESTVPGMYGGPLFARAPTEEHWDEFDKVPRWYEDIFLLDNPYSPYRWEPNGLMRWRFRTHVTDLQGGFDQVWKRYRRNARRDIRKAKDAGIEIRLAATMADARAYYEVYEDATLRFGDRLVSFYPLALFENLLAMPGYGEAVQLSLATIGGEVVSGLVMLYWGDVAVAWHASTRPASLASHPYPLLLASNMQSACAAGFRSFDFLLSGSLEGVAHFKEGFGGVSTTYAGYWSPGLTPDSTRPDTGPGAAAARIRELETQAVKA